MLGWTRAWWKLLALAVVAAGLLAALGGPDSSRAPAAAADVGVESELKALRAETERLRDQVSALQAAQAASAPAQAPALPPGLPPDLQARLSEMEAAVSASRAADSAPVLTPEQEREDVLDYGHFLDERLSRRSPGRADADQDAQLQSNVRDFLGAGSTLVEVRCAAELCRMLTRHKDLDSYHAFQSRAFQDSRKVWSGPISFIVLEEPDATGRPMLAASYLGRGDALPSPEPSR